MNRLLLLLLAVTLVADDASAASVRTHAADPRPAKVSAAVAIEQEVQRMAAKGPDALWPGFDPRAIPLAVYDGEQTFLFRHPAPPDGFVPVEGVEGAFLLYGRHETVQANSSGEIGGVPTATLLVDPTQPTRPMLDVSADAIHEGFLIHQRARKPDGIASEADLYAYPVDSAEILALRRLETEALRRALSGGEAETAECWARLALSLRAERYKRMDPIFATYERGTELNEGLATYVEMRAAGRRNVDLPLNGFGPAEIRRRAHVIGAALALVLDRVVPGWPSAFEANDVETLDEALAAALGSGNSCTFDAADMTAAKKRASSDVAALAGECGRRLAAFAGKPGSRVVVETGGGEPLWPQGFDPLNVERMGEARVLHTRFLKLGNAAGQLEVLGAEALTDGVGTYPLFQGVRRVELTGLVQPEVSESDGKVSVVAPGVTLEFTGAKLVRNGEVITVRLNP